MVTYYSINYLHKYGDWGLGIGDWGLGIGDWGLGPIPNPQIYLFFHKNLFLNKLNYFQYYKIIIVNSIDKLYKKNG